MQRFRHPSPAMIVAFIALIAALAGSAIALPGKGSVDSGDLKKGAVTKKAIKKGAVTKKAIKKKAVGSAQLKPMEATHVLGAPGETPFFNGGDGDCSWTPLDDALEGVTEPGYYKDPFGIVHLTGGVIQNHAAGGDGDCGDVGSTDDNNEDQTVFILPPAYRPAKAIVSVGTGSTFVVAPASGFSITPLPDLPVPPGGVAISSDVGDPVSLEGLSFRSADGAATASTPADPPSSAVAKALKLR